LFSDDHIILNADDFHGFIPKQLLVRTVTADKTESSNSDTIKLPQSLIQEITDGAAKNVTKDTPTKKTVKVRRIYLCFNWKEIFRNARIMICKKYKINVFNIYICGEN
jgi:hypothetical protein